MEVKTYTFTGKGVHASKQKNGGRIHLKKDRKTSQPRVEDELGHIAIFLFIGNIQPFESFVGVAMPGVSHFDGKGPDMAFPVDHVLPHLLI
jgi:hypothetical protein